MTPEETPSAFNDYAKQAAKFTKLKLGFYEEALYSMYKSMIYEMLADTKDHVMLPITNDLRNSSKVGLLAEEVLINGGSPQNVLTKLVNMLIKQGWDIEYYGCDIGKATVRLKHPLFDTEDD